MWSRRLPILLLWCVASSAQSVFVPIEGQRAAAAENLFERASTVSAMGCTFTPSAPILTFSLQYEAPYTMDFSVEQANWPPHQLDIFLRLQRNKPDEKTEYMGSRYIPPPQLVTKEAATLTGRFPLSPGDWRVAALAVDEDGKVCRNSWTVQAKDLAPVPLNSQPKLRRITVFVVSDPIYPVFGRLPSSAFEALSGSLSALVRSLPSEAVRVVVCNLALEKEFFRSERFHSANLPQAVKAIGGTETGTVNVANLRNPQLRLAFLADLINRELRESDPSNLVVFLGAAQEPSRVPRQMIATDGAHPLFIYIQYQGPRYAGGSRGSAGAIQAGRQGCGASETGGPCMGGPAAPAFNPRLRLAPGTVRDAISDAVSILKGQTFAVSTPGEFATSLARIVGAAGRGSKAIRP